MSEAKRAWALDVLNLVNIERGDAGRPPVAWDEGAAKVAYAHAIDMDQRNFFEHTNPDRDDPGDRLAAAGLAPRDWGENIAQGQQGPDAVMASWMASMGHRRNILDPAFTLLGVGLHVRSGGPWWVQDFLAP